MKEPKVVKRRTLASYDSRLIDLLVKCSLHDEFRLPCTSYKEAMNIRFRLQQVKKLMREENHPSASAVGFLQFNVDKGSTELYIRKNDKDIAPTIDVALNMLDSLPTSSEGSAPNLDEFVTNQPATVTQEEDGTFVISSSEVEEKS